MSIQTTQSYVDTGEGAQYFGLGNALRDVVLSFNRQLTFINNSAQTSAGLAINSNFDVKNANAITVTVGGVQKALSANTNFDTGTAATIGASQWGICILTWDGTTATLTWSQTASAQTYASEALAIAALRTSTFSVPAGFATIGYVTVHSDTEGWTAGTDALTTGTGGNPAVATNYYNDPTLNGAYGGWLIGNTNGVALTALTILGA